MIGTRMLLFGKIFVLSAAVAAAQTRTFDGEITSGSIVIEIIGFSHHVTWDISGTGFRLIGSAGDIYRVDACPFADGSCVEGSPVSLHAEVGQEQFGDGIAIVNGETLSPAYFLGGFYLPGGTATIPTKGNRKFVKVSAPFSTTVIDARHIVVYSDTTSRSLGGESWAQGALFGSGIATVTLERFRIGKQSVYQARRVVYTFGVQ